MMNYSAACCGVVHCLIDSGSPVSIVHSSLGAAAGIIPVMGEKGTLTGVGGGILRGNYTSHKLKFG